MLLINIIIITIIIIIIVIIIYIIIVKQGKQNDEVFQLSLSCTILDTVILLVLIANVCCSWPWGGDYHIFLAHQDCQVQIRQYNLSWKKILLY